MAATNYRTIKRVKAHRKLETASLHGCGFESLESRQLLSCVLDIRIAGGGKAANVTTVGQTVQMQVWAVVTGADNTGTNDGFQSVAGSFLSTSSASGSVLGNMSSTELSPFDANGAQPGTPADLDGDGDLDVGGNDPNNFPPYFSARSGSIVTSGGVISGGTQSFEIGTITFVVTNLKSGQATNINFRERGDDSFTGGALWMEDGQFVDSTLGSFTDGAPVVITDTAIQPSGQVVSGEVYTDANSNGKLDSGEAGLTGVKVFIDSNNDGVMQSTEPNTVTNGSGLYSFSGIAAGAYVVRQTVPSGFKQTAPSGGLGQHITVTKGSNFGGVNFGDASTSTATGFNISGEVYKDTNSNGTLDSGESGIGSVTVYIDANNDGTHQGTETSVLTDQLGNYVFTNQKAGSYTVRQIVPSGDTQTAPKSGAAQTVKVTTANVTGVNFGDAVTSVTPPTVSISGEVYRDANSNGKLDSGETGLASVVVFIDANNDGVMQGSEAHATTDSGGLYSFSGVSAGAVIVRQTVPSGFKQTAPSGGLGQHVTVTAGKTTSGVNFGDASTSVTPPPPTPSISGEVYKDVNGNAKLDSGETGLGGVVVFIDANNDGIMQSSEAHTTTDANGLYSLTGVTAGAVIVRQTLPSGYKQTAPTNNMGNHVTVTAGKTTANVNFGDEATATPKALVAASSALFSDSAIKGDQSLLEWATE